MVPLLCGLASRDRGEQQRVVARLVRAVGPEEQSDNNAEFYLRFLQVDRHPNENCKVGQW